jgi:hypothetical protein
VVFQSFRLSLTSNSMDLVFGLANRETKMYDGNIGTPLPPA